MTRRGLHGKENPERTLKGKAYITGMFSYKFLVYEYATSFKVKIQFDHFRS